MKRVYEKPVFYAEAYSISEDIAATTCTRKYDPKTPLSVPYDSAILCPAGDEGHVFDSTSPAYSVAVTNGWLTDPCDKSQSITIFNDGASSTACQFDWQAKSVNGELTQNTVLQTGKSFSESFHKQGGNGSSTSAKHRPGYEGTYFFS